MLRTPSCESTGRALLPWKSFARDRLERHFEASSSVLVRLDREAVKFGNHARKQTKSHPTFCFNFGLRCGKFDRKLERLHRLSRNNVKLLKEFWIAL